LITGKNNNQNSRELQSLHIITRYTQVLEYHLLKQITDKTPEWDLRKERKGNTRRGTSGAK